MPSATPAQLVELARRHQAQLLTVRDRTEQALRALWARTVVDPTEATATRWLAQAVPLLQAGERAAVSAGLSFVTGYVQAALGTVVRPPDLAVADFLTPRGVDLTELLLRPIITVRTRLSEGDRLPVALDAGQFRAAQIGGTDPMLSYRAATSEAMQREPRIVGYRRVPDGKACSFCLVAATQRYHDADLMAMHPSCGCTVAPIVGSKDPGQVIDHQTLQQMRDSGVIDDISRRRRAAAERTARSEADKARTKADHWRRQAAQATDVTTRTRYEKRAEEWERRARVAEGSLPAPNLDAARQLERELFHQPHEFITVHDHGELGPTLYEAGHHFDTA